MTTRTRRKCRHCGQLFRPDPRNLRHQRYCSAKECRRASKAASQRRWLAKAENRDYFRGPEQVARVRTWRDAHPGYARKTSSRRPALQEHSSAQPVDIEEQSDVFSAPAWDRSKCGNSSLHTRAGLSRGTQCSGSGVSNDARARQRPWISAVSARADSRAA